MHRCTHKAAGGTIHRLKPGPDIILCRLNRPAAAVVVLISVPLPLVLLWIVAGTASGWRAATQRSMGDRGGQAARSERGRPSLLLLFAEKSRAIRRPRVARGPSIERRRARLLSRPHRS